MRTTTMTTPMTTTSPMTFFVSFFFFFLVISITSIQAWTLPLPHRQSPGSRWNRQRQRQRQRQEGTLGALSMSSSDDDTTTVVEFDAQSLITAGRSVDALKNELIVVKYGGNAMTSPELKQQFCQDVATLQQLGVSVVVVHGGGPQINQLLQDLQVESQFSPGGMRISTKDVVRVAEMVLCGSVNKEIVACINQYGGHAIGLSGRDDSLLQCIPQDLETLGYVGQVEKVNVQLLQNLLQLGLCPVISPIGTGLLEKPVAAAEPPVAYNVNADVAAGRIAGELRASRVFFLTDIAGVLNKQKELIPQLSMQQVQELIQDETITGGMIPKISFATSAVELGVKAALITDGRVPHALLKEVLGGGATAYGTGQGGTVITKTTTETDTTNE